MNRIMHASRTGGGRGTAVRDACNMTTDDQREPNRDRRRRLWLARPWRVSKRGNFWLATGDYHVVVFGHRVGRWRARVTYLPSKEWWISDYWETIEDARLAALPLLDKVRRQVNAYLRDHPNAFAGWRIGGPRPSEDSSADESFRRQSSY
jgi:hypothetical protein